MGKKIKKYLIICLIVVAVIGAFLLYSKLKPTKKEEVKEEAKEVDVIQTKEFDYVLYDNKSDLYQETFKKLKEELMKDEIDDLEYAKIISELFVIDFYSLNDKKTNTDVGGLDFILEDIKENFTLKATDTIYKYVESNIYGDRKQELPQVSAIEVKNIEKKSVNSNVLNDENGYQATLSITYDKDLGYPKEVNLVLVHKENKIYIIEVK